MRLHRGFPAVLDCSVLLWVCIAGRPAGAQTAPADDFDIKQQRQVYKEGLEVREIRESSAKDVGEALAKVDGLWKVRKAGIANDIVLRGFQQDNINVLIDGDRIYGACPNNMDPPAFHVDFAEVDRVEVTKGVFDTANQGSLGGTVNVVRKTPAAGLHFSPALGIGSFGFWNPSLAGSYYTGAFRFRAGYSYRVSDPYKDGLGKRFTDYANFRSGVANSSAFDVNTGFIVFGVSPAPNHDLEVSYTRQQAGSALYPYLQMDALYDNADRAGVKYEWREPSRALRVVRVSGYFTGVRHWMTDQMRLSSDGALAAFGMATFASTRAAGGKAEVSGAWFTAGFESYVRNWNALNSMRRPGMMRDQAALPNVYTRLVGAYVDVNRTLTARLRLGAGFRLDRAAMEATSNGFDSDLYQAYKGTRDNRATDAMASGNLRLTYSLADSWELFAGAGSSARVPDAQERYFALRRSGSDWVGNPALPPLRNTEGDVGLTIRGRRFYVKPLMFYSAVGNFVVVHNQPRLQALPGLMNTMARSYTPLDARLYGGELTYGVDLTRRFLISGGFSYTRGVKDTDPARRVFDSNLAEMPPFRGRLGLRYGRKWYFAEAETIAVGRQGRVDRDLQELATPGYLIVNARLGIHVKRLQFTTGVDNATNRFYFESFSYQRDPFRSGARIPEPGRAWFLSVNYGL